MKLSVAIVNWNTRDFLRACLRSLQEHPCSGGQEVIVVDNASADGSAAMVREEFPGVILVANDWNRCYAEATNQALRLAKGERVLLLNPDTEFPAGALDALDEALDRYPKAAAVAPRLIEPDGSTQHSVRGFPAPGALLAEVLGLPRLFPRSRRVGAYRMRWWAYDDEREVDQPMASCLLIRREALEDVGLIDEAFPMFFNDVDWCYRARAKGWSIRFTPRAHVFHHGGASTRQVRAAMLRESGRSLEHFYRKHYRGRVSAPLYWAVVLLGRLGTWVRCAMWARRNADRRRETGDAGMAGASGGAGSRERGAGSREQGAGSKEQGARSREQGVAAAGREGAGSKERGAGAKEQGAVSGEQGARSGEQGAGSKGGEAPSDEGDPSRITPHASPLTHHDLVISIINWNTRGDLETCLRSIFAANADGPTIQVAVVDNASADGSPEMVAERFPQVHLVRNKGNRGFGAANNQVMKGSQSRYVFMLNPDTETHPGALAALVRFMDENPDVGICGPLILNPDGSVQYSARRFPTLIAGVFRNTLLGRLFPNNRFTRDYLLSDWDHRSQRDVDWLSGAAMVVRREVIDQIGVFDERFFMYSEDVDLCYRAGKAGWRITFFPGASITHAKAHSSDQAQGKMLIQFHRSMYRFWRKHYAPNTFFLLRPLVPCVIATRAVLLLAKNATDRLRKRLQR